MYYSLIYNCCSNLPFKELMFSRFQNHSDAYKLRFLKVCLEDPDKRLQFLMLGEIKTSHYALEFAISGVLGTRMNL